MGGHGKEECSFLVVEMPADTREGIHEKIELSLVLTRQILELLSSARVERPMATTILDAAKAHVSAVISAGTRI
jgi:hypothetical protein